MQMLSPYRQFSDSRGRMLGVINDGQWEEINYIETAASCMRGGHFHRDTRELFLILSGTIKVRINGKTLSFDAGEAVVSDAAVLRAVEFARRTPRATPLPSRLTEEEQAAHAAFIEKLGPNALWLKAS